MTIVIDLRHSGGDGETVADAVRGEWLRRNPEQQGVNGERISEAVAPSRRKIAILLPNSWRGGMLRNAWVLAGLLAERDWPGIGNVDVVVGLLGRTPYDWQLLRREVAALGPKVSLRRMDWESRPVAGLRTIFGSLLAVPPGIAGCSVPRDYGHDFLDCDAWIVFSYSLEGFVVPARPVAIYCADQIQRYVPEIFAGDGEEGRWMRQSETHLGWRHARFVFATTPQTRSDVVSYAGVQNDRALLVPTLVDPLGSAASLHASVHSSGQISGESEPYILWITNATPHKNHRAVMAALRSYYGEYGGKLPVVVAGIDTNLLAPYSGADNLASRSVHEATDVLPNLRFAGEVSNAAYMRLVSGAAVVWHNVIVDNGTFVAFDAARADRHFVSSDYPQMRYLCERYGIAALWHPPGDTTAAAVALLEAGRRAAAGEKTGHALRQDSKAERHAAYGTLLGMLLGDVDA